jgi:8-oxo-dGTP diphosphatase
VESTRVACAGAIVRDDRGRLLMIKRGTAPGMGQWSVPGGRVEPGESAAAAAVREVEEETGLRVCVGGLAGVVELSGPEGVVYEVEDYYARVAPGTDPRAIRAGDDAADVGWFFLDQLLTMDCVAGLLDTLRGWRVVPRQR